jgi:Fe-S-cluster containining protein
VEWEMHSDHDAILNDWRKNAEKHDEENFRFLRSLKMVRHPDRVDAEAQELHEEAFRRIDCVRCANCCKTMRAVLKDEEIEPIASHVGLAREAFIAEYLEPDPEEGGYRIRAMPCPFLDADDRCTIYEVRPMTCREFPHTDKEGFSTRPHLLSSNALTCPAVYYIIEQMRRRRRRR